MIKRSTWVVLFLFLAIAGVYLYLRYRPAPEAEATPTPTDAVPDSLFTEQNGNLVRLYISDQKGSTVLLRRPPGGLWTIVLPAPGPANIAEAEAGASQALSLSVVDIVKDPPPLSAMGLDPPSYVIKLTFANSVTHTLEIGNQTPSGQGYYVLLDKKAIYIVRKYGMDALLNLHANPPYLPATSTPLPPTSTPTPEATAAPESTAVTPEPAATPTP